MNLFSEKKFISSRTGRELKYLCYSPNTDGNLPLIIYLHGAGSRGTELSQLSHAGPIGELERGRNIPARMVAPQCCGDTWFELFETLMDFAESMANESGVDKSRIYLTGVSMGAYAAWQLAMTKPDMFAALVPVCGGGMYWNGERLKNMPIWAFHGALDDDVYPEESIKMVYRINKSGGNAKITVFEKADHNAWDPAYALDEMWDWMFLQVNDLRRV